MFGTFWFFCLLQTFLNESNVRGRRVLLWGWGEASPLPESFFCHLNRINEKIIMITKQTVVVVALVAGKTDWIEAAAATWGGGGACLWWDDTGLRVTPVQQLELSGSRVTTRTKPEPKKTKKQAKLWASLMCLLVGTSWSPSTHIGKPLTVDLLLYMSTTSTTTTSTTSFPHALTVWNGSKWIKTAICIAVFVNLNQWW